VSALRLTVGDVSGVVQGAGGPVSSKTRLDQAICHARAGRPHGLYEPEPGCVLMFPEWAASRSGPAVVVSLRDEPATP